VDVAHLKFDLAKLERLNDPGRFETLVPDVMWAALGSPSPATIVEIGAGTGVFAVEFARRAPGATVYAADMEPAMVEWMSEHRPEVAAGRVVPLLSTETGVPLPDASADLVAMINLQHELAEPSAIYEEVFRLLVPGGQLLAVDWAPIETPKGPPPSVRVSAQSVVALACSLGFEEATSHEGLPWHWLVTARKPFLPDVGSSA
jgi:ubiquinone/menaquinone biosynthesis C-methylase UbiE